MFKKTLWATVALSSCAGISTPQTEASALSGGAPVAPLMTPASDAAPDLLKPTVIERPACSDEQGVKFGAVHDRVLLIANATEWDGIDGCKHVRAWSVKAAEIEVTTRPVWKNAAHKAGRQGNETRGGLNRTVLGDHVAITLNWELRTRAAHVTVEDVRQALHVEEAAAVALDDQPFGWTLPEALGVTLDGDRWWLAGRAIYQNFESPETGLFSFGNVDNDALTQSEYTKKYTVIDFNHAVRFDSSRKTTETPSLPLDTFAHRPLCPSVLWSHPDGAVGQVKACISPKGDLTTVRAEWINLNQIGLPSASDINALEGESR